MTEDATVPTKTMLKLTVEARFYLAEMVALKPADEGGQRHPRMGNVKAISTQKRLLQPGNLTFTEAERKRWNIHQPVPNQTKWDTHEEASEEALEADPTARGDAIPQEANIEFSRTMFAMLRDILKEYSEAEALEPKHYDLYRLFIPEGEDEPDEADAVGEAERVMAQHAVAGETDDN